MVKKSTKKMNKFDLKKIVGTVWGKVLLGVLALFILSLSSLKIYVSDTKFVPEVVKNANEKIVETFLGKELAEQIDQKRDADGATTIRELFNTNKEENLVRHCEEKDEKGQEQFKCSIDEDDGKVGKKKYRNEEFGFSVKYPESYNVETLDVAPRVVFSEEPIKKDTDQLAPIELFVSEGNLNDLVAEIKKSTLSDYKEETIKLGNIDAIKISGFMGLFYWGEAKHTYILYENKGKVHEWNAYTEDVEVESDFLKMISTLKLE